MGPGGKLISYRPLALSAAEVEEVEEDGGGLFLLSFSAEAGIELELTDDDAGVVVEVAAADAFVARRMRQTKTRRQTLWALIYDVDASPCEKLRADS